MGARRQDYQPPKSGAGDVSFLLVKGQSRREYDIATIAGPDVDPASAVCVPTRLATWVAVGRHHNPRPNGAVRLPRMALGHTRRTRAPRRSPRTSPTQGPMPVLRPRSRAHCELFDANSEKR